MTATDELKLPSDTRLAGKIVEGHVKNEQMKVERGLIGRLFGSRNSAPINVVSIIALVASVFYVFAVPFWAGRPAFSYEKAAATLSSLITLAIGYLFGRASKD